MPTGAFALGPTVVKWSADCRWTAELLLALVRYLPAADPQLASTHLSVEQATGVLASPAQGGLAPSCHFGSVQGFSAPDRLHLWDGHSIVTSDFGGERITALVSEHSDLHVFSAVMLFVGLAIGLRAHGLFHTHAACVLMPELGVVLVPGGSGSGKTTTALGLWAAGGRLLSDDAVFMSSASGRTTIHSWPRDLHVGDRTLEAFPELAGAPYKAIREGNPKRAIPLRCVADIPTDTAETPAAILLPAISERATTTANEAPQSAVLAELLEQSALLAIPGAVAQSEHLQLLESVARCPQRKHLSLGADFLRAPARVLTQALGLRLSQPSQR